MRHAISACRFFYKMQSSRLRNLFLQWRAARVWVSSLHNNRVLLSASPKVEQKSKNWEKCSTAALKICARVSGSRTKKQKLGKMFYRATPETALPRQLSYWEVLPKFSPHAPSSQHRVQMQHRITAASKSTGFYKKRTAENRTVLEMCRIYLFLSY